MRGLAFASSLLGMLVDGGAQRVTEENMNGEYLLAQTPRGHGNWSTNFKDYPGGVESFTIYAGPINSTYSEVFWTSLPEVNLPAEIVKRFKGKAMAIVGFESDQVRRTPDGDVSLPINLAVRPYPSVASTQRHLRLFCCVPAVQPSLRRNATRLWLPHGACALRPQRWWAYKVAHAGARMGYNPCRAHQVSEWPANKFVVWLLQRRRVPQIVSWPAPALCASN